MSLDGKHNFGSIGETRVTFVEKGVSADRRDFLQKLLEHNGLEVLIEEEPPKAEGEPTLYTVAVTDMVFNPTIWIFQRRLHTFDNRKVSQDYWFQRTEESSPKYWRNS